MIDRTIAMCITLLLAQAAAAQHAVIERCKQTSSDADRIACLESALLGKELATAEETEVRVDPPDVESDPEPAVTETLDTAPVVAAVTVAETKAAAAPEPAPAATSAPVGIGAEQVIARTQTTEERREALEELLGQQIESYGYVPYERLVVRLENGQVWRQIKGDTKRIRVDLKRNQTADITESNLGGYKLRLNEMRRTIRVERIK